ncbi:mycothiol transferase [Propionibacteriaceae bacterium Y1685]|uniref:mycothiol transferase n=1 Tax=Microlunatus sp. Y1700 TaxID=3418487 RepID=UPI003B76E536
MKQSALLNDAIDRIVESAHDIAEGLSAADLAYRPGTGANGIGWLLWHLTRVQDDHIADAAGTEQVWTSAGWAERFGLPYGTEATGYGQDIDEVARFSALDPTLLTAYLDAVTARTKEYLDTLSDSDFDRIVDENWDPPVTLGARLISVINDDTQHIGQAAYVRGLLEAHGS